MKKVFVIAILTALLITGVSITVLSQKTPEKPVYVAQKPTVFKEVPLNADTIFDLVNQERIKAGIKPLVRDVRLDKSAQFKADDMATRKYFDHYDPTDPTSMNGVQKAYQLTSHTCAIASENISDGIYSDDGNFNKNVVRSWMNSKPHHDAILLEDYDLAGIGLSGTKIAFHFCNLK